MSPDSAPEATPGPPASLVTLADVARWRARAQAEELIFTFLVDGETEVGHLSYRELDLRARAIAAELQAHRAEGERVVLLFAPGLDYVAAVFGCFYAGALAVPAYPPDPFRLQRTFPRLQAIWEDAQARFVLTSEEVLSYARGHLAHHDNLRSIPVETIPAARAADWRATSFRGENMALIQYTSGSTGSPRGVMLSHANIMHNLRSMHRVDTDGVGGVCWLPPYHDMGLVGGIFQAVYSGRRSVMMSPLAFIQRPVRWLRAMSNYRGRTSGGPNFAYDLCVEKIRPEECRGLDLSCWTAAISGAEPVRAETIERFVERFGPYGFRREAFLPGFGLAESVLMVAGGPRDAPPVIRTFSAAALLENRIEAADGCQSCGTPGRRLVGCGQPLSGGEIVIVDPKTRREVGPGRVGEIWVHSPSAGKGYWNRPEETELTFRARIVGDSDRCYLRTGDLGFLHEGELFITGRLKELILLGGHNYYPQDIERTVQQAHRALKRDAGAAFTVEADGQERLVVVNEILRPRRWNTDDILRAVRRELAEDQELSPYAVALIPAGTLPKTSSGKTRRSRCREMFLRGHLPTVAVWYAGARPHVPGDEPADDPPQTDTERRLARIWAEVLAIRARRRSDDFFAMGGHSLRAVQLAGRINAEWDIELPLMALFEHPSLADLARAIDRQRSRRAANGDGQARGPVLQPLAPAERSGPQPLSFAQERLWFLEQLSPGPSFAVVPLALRLTGPLDVPSLREAVGTVVHRHEVLRTTFRQREGRLWQEVAAEGSAAWEEIDLTGIPSDQRPARLRQLADQMARRRFNLETGPPFRVTVARVAPQEHVLLLVLHHIVCDGWSLEVLLREIAALYEAACHGNPACLPPLPVQYVDYVHWQRRRLSGERLRDGLDYWRRRLEGAPRVLEIPTDWPRSARGPLEGAACTQPIPRGLYRSLESLARQRGCTPFMVFLAALDAVLSRYVGSDDVCVGTPVANRLRPELEPLVGCFMNTVVLRCDVAGNSAFADLLLRVRNSVLQDFVHAEVPFEKLVESLDPAREAGRLPLVQVMFIFQPPIADLGAMDGVQLKEVKVDYTGLAAFDLALVVEPRGSEVAATLAYNRAWFEESTVRRVLGSLMAVLEAVAADPAVRLADLPVPAPSERRQLLADWNATARRVPELCGVHELIEAQAARSPDATAVTFEGRATTYRGLQCESNRLAWHLRRLGVGPGTRVGIHVERSPRMIAAMLAVLKAGACYVPLDPAYPAQRLAFMVADGSLGLVLTESEQNGFSGIAPPTPGERRCEGPQEEATSASECSVLGTQYSALRHDSSAFGTQHAEPSTQYSVLSTQCLAIGAQHPVPCTQFSVPSTQPSVLSSLSSAPALGTRPSVLSTEYSVLGTQYSVLSPKRSTLAADVGPRIVRLDLAGEALCAESTERLPVRVSAEDLAYLIYTSGSMGEPKGVMIPHRAVVNFLAAFAEEPGLKAGDTVLAITTVSFDIAVFELLLPLAVGARIVLAPRELAVDGWRLGELVRREGVNVIQATPSTYRLLLATGWRPEPGQKILCGGEAMSGELASRLAPEGVELWNVYGPTETTVWSTIHRVDRCDGAVPIGRPIANTQAYVLDAKGLPAPIGVPGELCLGGLGVAAGYWNRPELTAQRFVPDRFAASPGSRLYRTGDRVRWRHDGVLEFLGRTDRQVKIRGFRVELGEIEAALSARPEIAEAAVLPKDDSSGQQHLVAYLVPAQGKQLVPETLRASLAGRLPEYMVPSAFVVLEAMPRTSAGKVDWQALAARQCGRMATTAPYVAPRTPLEEKIAAAWAELLHVERVGVHDNFFELGGHSLLATQMMSRLRDLCTAELPLRALFERPTVAGLAEAIAAGQPDAGASGDAARVRKQAIPRRPPDEPADLSFAEQRLWFLDQLQPQNPFYNMPMAARLTGPFDESAFARSLESLVARHETLRTTFPASNGLPQRTIAPGMKIPIERTDLRDVPRAERETRLQRRLREEARKPLDLAKGPLLRSVLFRVSESEWVVLLAMHHIISDGWSMAVMLRELAILYDAFTRGRTPDLPPLEIQYSDFAAWQRRHLTGDVLRRELAYWREKLGDQPPVLELPSDRPRPSAPSFDGATRPFSLSPELSRKLCQLARQEQATLFVVLLAAYNVLLGRYCRQEDVAVGTGVANRTRRESEGLIGFFTNTLVLRTDLSGNPSFREVIRRTREVALDAHGHQELPFEKLVELLDPERQRNAAPLFQAAMVLQNAPMEIPTTSGLRIEPLAVDNGTSKYDLTLFFSERGEQLAGSVEYQTALFEAATIDRMIGCFGRLLETAVEDPGRPIGQMPLVDEAQRRQVLVEFNADADTEKDSRPRSTLHAMFEEHAARTPGRIAVRYAGRDVTYGELDRRAEDVARFLHAAGIRAETPVAVCLRRSADLLAAMLGVLKSGGAYVPIDPDQPKDRIAFLLDDTQTPLVLTETALLEHLPAANARLVPLDDAVRFREAVGEAVGNALCGVPEPARDACSAAPGTPQRAFPTEDEAGPTRPGSESAKKMFGTVRPDQLAYVIYTSGSTGRPKGVLVEHRSIVNFVRAQTRFLGVSPDWRILQFFSPCFDGAIAEAFLALGAGACLVIGDQDSMKSADAIKDLIVREQVNFSKFSPSMLQLLPSRELPGLRTICCAGEALDGELVARWSPGRRMFNAYGPTEAAVGACMMELDGPIAHRPPIGRPLTNVRVYVLDPHLEPVPIGVPGEICIAGIGVARGYLNRPELTAERFVPDPFAITPGARMYRTGDLGRWRPEGTLEFLGRLDDQVKIRGYRIEPGEVATVLQEHPGVRRAAVVAREDQPGGPRLVAYVVPSQQGREASGDDAGLEHEHVDRWKTLFDETLRRSIPPQDPAMNLTGWVSSRSGLPFPEAEMWQWVEGAVARVLALRPRRVLEIGCGTGLLLFRIAPHCESYVGTDFSAESLQTLAKAVEPREELRGRVRLVEQPADRFDGLEPSSFDVIVLNSVVQYFPSASYLLRVLDGASRLVAPGAHVFLGDLRSLPLGPALACSIEMARADDAMGTRALRRRVEARWEREEELLVGPGLMAALPARLPRLQGWQTLLKRGPGSNELFQFRYDAVLHFDHAVRPDGGGEIDWDAGPQTPAEIASLLTEELPDTLTVRGVRNARIAREQRAWQFLQSDDGPPTLGELRARVDRDAVSESADPEEFWRLAEVAPYDVEIGWSGNGEDGRYDVVFRRREREEAASIPGEGDEAGSACRDEASPLPTEIDWNRYTNHPLDDLRVRRTVASLRLHLQTRLPDYMIPAAFVMLDALPLSVQGKLDRRALPAPPSDRPGWSAGYVAPRDEHEQVVAGAWERLLGVSPVGIADNFFELGGHSMLAVRMIAEIERVTGRRLPLASLFQQATVEHLARLLREPEVCPPETSLVPLQTHGSGRPFFCVHPAGGTVFCYRLLAEHLGSDRPFFGLQAVGIDGGRPPQEVAEEMAAHYVAAIRSVQPHGPYFLGGWSLGGNLAFEMSRQLVEQGERVGLLALLDAAALPPEKVFNQDDFLPLIAELFPSGDDLSVDALRAMTPQQHLEYFLRRAAMAGIVLPNFDPGAGGHVFEVFKSNLKAMMDYRPRPYPGKATLLFAEEKPQFIEIARDPQLGWGMYVQGGVEVIRIPGDHVHMVQEPNVRIVAEKLRACLASAEAEG